MLQNNEKRHASIPISTYTQQPITNRNVTPQFTQTEQSSLNILPSIPNTPKSTIASVSSVKSNTPKSTILSEELFTYYVYREHSYEEHDDSPKSKLNGRSEGEVIFNDNPTGVNEFEAIIQNEPIINVAKDDKNRKEAPEEQKKRLYTKKILKINLVIL